jgi:hypothetical protein
LEATHVRRGLQRERGKDVKRAPGRKLGEKAAVTQATTALGATTGRGQGCACTNLEVRAKVN